MQAIILPEPNENPVKPGLNPIQGVCSMPVAISIKISQTFTECMKITTDHHIRHLPIMDKQNVIRLISIGDVVKEILEEQNRTIEQLKSYIVS